MLTLTRTAEGNYRWFAWPAATAVLNRVGEIDSRELFDNFIRRIHQGAEWPYLTFWHLGEQFKIGETDFVAREDLSYLMSGTIDDNRWALAMAKALARENRPWGTSINYLPEGPPYTIYDNGKPIPVYRDGRQIEVSILPEERAAAFGTAVFSTYRMEDDSMNKLIRDALINLAVSDPVLLQELEARVDEVNRAGSGAISREGEAETETGTTTEAGTEEPTGPTTVDEVAQALLDNETFQAGIGELVTRGIKPVADAVSSMQGDVTAMSEMVTAMVADAQDREATEREAALTAAGEQNEEAAQSAKKPPVVISLRRGKVTAPPSKGDEQPMALRAAETLGKITAG